MAVADPTPRSARRRCARRRRGDARPGRSWRPAPAGAASFHTAGPEFARAVGVAQAHWGSLPCGGQDRLRLAERGPGRQRDVLLDVRPVRPDELRGRVQPRGRNGLGEVLHGPHPRARSSARPRPRRRRPDVRDLPPAAAGLRRGRSVRRRLPHRRPSSRRPLPPRCPSPPPSGGPSRSSTASSSTARASAARSGARAPTAGGRGPPARGASRAAGRLAPAAPSAEETPGKTRAKKLVCEVGIPPGNALSGQGKGPEDGDRRRGSPGNIRRSGRRKFSPSDVVIGAVRLISPSRGVRNRHAAGSGVDDACADRRSSLLCRARRSVPRGRRLLRSRLAGVRERAQRRPAALGQPPVRRPSRSPTAGPTRTRPSTRPRTGPPASPTARSSSTATRAWTGRSSARSSPTSSVTCTATGTRTTRTI